MRDTAMSDHESPEQPEPQTPADESPTQTGGTATATRPRPAPPKRKVEHLPPWRVLLHNDSVNDMLYVVESIVALTPLGRQEAVKRMMEAHITGLSMLLVTHKERAELYRDQFRSKRLTVTIEPAEG